MRNASTKSTFKGQKLMIISVWQKINQFGCSENSRDKKYSSVENKIKTLISATKLTPKTVTPSQA